MGKTLFINLVVYLFGQECATDIADFLTGRIPTLMIWSIVSNLSMIMEKSKI